MKLKFLASFFCLLSLSCVACDSDSDNDPDLHSPESLVDREVTDAFNFLNAIRFAPSSYSSTVGCDLSDVNPQLPLEWNEALAKVAQRKAEDMVARNYFSHTDPDGYGINYYINKEGYKLNPGWYSDVKLNYFESIAAGNSTGKQTVIQLVYDSGRPDSEAGHRSHLLGISDWNASCTDIGIGHAYGPQTQYKHYWSFVIAKHDF